MALSDKQERPTSWSLWLIGLICGLVVFHLLSGQILSPLKRLISPGPALLSAVELDINGHRVSISPGQDVVLRPFDHIRVVKLETNQWSNDDLSLTGRGFDASPMNTGVQTSRLLPVDGQTRSFEVMVNRGVMNLGRFHLVPVNLPVDWVLLASTIEGPNRLKYLKRAMEKSGPNSILQAEIARTARSLGLVEQSGQAMANRLSLVFSPAEMAALASIYRNTSKISQEVETLKVLAELEPDNQEIVERLLFLAERSEDEKLKLDTLQRLAETAPGTRSVEALKKLGYTLYKAGRWAEAAEAYSKAAKVDIRDANVFANLAEIYAKLGDKKSRREALLKYSLLKPKNVKVSRELARTAPSDQQLAAWRRVLKAAPTDEAALVRVIDILEKDEPSPELAEMYIRLAAVRPSDQVVHYNLGLTQAALGQLKLAEVSLNRAHRLMPNDPDSLTALLDVRLKAKKTSAAADTAEVLIGLKPKDLNLYRLIYGSLNRKKTAERKRLEAILVRGVKANPKSAELWRMLTINRLASGNKNGAVRALIKAVSLKPKDVSNRLRLAKLLEATKKDKAALKQYQTILKLKPDHKEAGKAYLRLKLKLMGN